MRASKKINFAGHPLQISLDALNIFNSNAVKEATYVSGPTFRIEERTDEIVDRLKEAALEVSMRLGWGHRQVTTPE